MHTIRFFPLILVIVLLLTSCDREPYVRCQSDPTCEYFRCKVNGKWWTPDCEQGPLFGCDHTDLQYYRYLNGGGVSLYSNKRSDMSGIIITANNVQDINVNYKLFRQGKYSEFYIKNKSNQWDTYNVDTIQHNEIRFSKIDTINYILEGTFRFEGINNDGERKIISDGEFRLHYRF